MKQVLVIGYPNDWHWVLSLEYASTQNSEDLEVWDISWAGEKGFKNLLKMVVGGNRLQRNCKTWLKSKGIPVRKMYLYYLPKRKIINQYESLVSENLFIDPHKNCTIYNTLVEKTGTLRVNPKIFKNAILRELESSMIVQRSLEKKELAPDTQIVTVNGRFTKNATVKEWADSRSYRRLLLEFGSTRESLEVFHTSPHSTSEISQKMNSAWHSASILNREEIALKYLDALKANKISTINWREKIQERYVPNHPEKKKICVFFASTEVEHAGVGDKISNDSFESQDEAFSGLVQALPPNEWHLYVRRHPRNPLNPSYDDPESQLWDKFRNLSNVTIIEPNSPVDSITLGMSANLVTNYWSTIAIELILFGHPRVVTLGSAPWNTLIPECALTSTKKIQDYLALSHNPIDPDRIYPWAYFQATFGEKFQLFKFSRELGRWSFQ